MYILKIITPLHVCLVWREIAEYFRYLRLKCLPWAMWRELVTQSRHFLHEGSDLVAIVSDDDLKAARFT